MKREISRFLVYSDFTVGVEFESESKDQNMRVPGYVMRQSLVDELRNRIEEKRKELSTTTDQLSIMEILGHISALEDLSKWALDHTAPSLTNERC